MGHTDIPGGTLYLQFEGGRLCFKLHAGSESQRKKLREQVDAAFNSLGLLRPELSAADTLVIPPKGALAITAPPRRLSTEMTVGYVDDLLSGLPARWEELGAALHNAEQVVRQVAGTLGG